MKRILSLIAIATLVGLSATAQTDKKSTGGVQFGIKAGINVANLKWKEDGISLTTDSKVGVNAGFFLTAPISENFSIQPELTYSGLGAKSDGETLALNYITVPVLAKYTFAGSGFGIYAGPQIGLLLSAKSDGEDIKDAMKGSDFAGIFGVDYSVSKFNFAARYQIGLSNIAKDAEDGSLKNNAFTFTVGYRIK
jgi:hypothetical protein